MLRDIPSTPGVPTSMLRLPKTRDRQRSRGQSVVEFALMLPIFLSGFPAGSTSAGSSLVGSNLNNTARIAANYAANHASAWQPPRHCHQAIPAGPLSSIRIATMPQQINCSLPDPIPPPVIAGGTALGSPGKCRFRLAVCSMSSRQLSRTSSAAYPPSYRRLVRFPGQRRCGRNSAGWRERLLLPPPDAEADGRPRAQAGAPSLSTYRDTSRVEPTGWTLNV